MVSCDVVNFFVFMFSSLLSFPYTGYNTVRNCGHMKFLFTRFLVNGLLFLPFFLNRENFIQDDIGCILLAHKLE